MNRSIRQKSGQGGFTLIELLIALAVTAVGLAGLMSLHVAMMKGNRAASNTHEATTIGQETIEELRGMTIAAIEAQHGALPLNDVVMDTVPSRRAYDPQTGIVGLTFTRTLSINPISGRLLLVRVVISWSDDGADPAAADPQFRHEIALEIIRTSLEAP